MLPEFHIGGINGLLAFLALGAASVLTPTTGFDPNRALRLLEAHGVTMCIFVPTQWDAICASPRVVEIVYRDRAVMSGYWRNGAAGEEASRASRCAERAAFAGLAAFAGGWFHSGDLATRDGEGYLRLVDRKKDMIISGGENICPAEVERALLEHPAIVEAAVVGVPHPRWVETPVAFVVAAPGRLPAEEELIVHLRSRLASYKKPSAVIFVEALPRNAAGKVLKRDLRDAHRDRSDAPARQTGGTHA